MARNEDLESISVRALTACRREFAYAEADLSICSFQRSASPVTTSARTCDLNSQHFYKNWHHMIIAFEDPKRNEKSITYDETLLNSHLLNSYRNVKEGIASMLVTDTTSLNKF